MLAERPYDLILLGATGFTGRLVTEYLLQTYGVQGKLSWAIAGRDEQKLKRLRVRFKAENLPYLVADSHDAASLDQLATQARVICTTVGPYAQHGSETVAACVRNGTHYCDLCGEVQWMRRMIDQHHGAAKDKQCKIVHTCGFDSVPSEMGVFYLQQQALGRTNQYCQDIKTGLKSANGGFSGGTLASLLYVLEEAEKDPSIYKILGNPYGLNPQGTQQGPDGPDQREVRFDKDFLSWTCPFVMAAINTRVVRRGHALRGMPYGQQFSYQEMMLAGSGVFGRIRGYLFSLPAALMMSARPGTLIRRLLDWLAPKPGQGPSRKTREEGYWVYDVIGKLPDGRRLKARIKGDRDPGYGSTSKMLAESAVCLALDDLPDHYGVLTPATAMGEPLLHRLRDRAGLSFEIRS